MWPQDPRLTSGHEGVRRDGLLEVTGTFEFGRTIRLELPWEPRITPPDPRIDAARGTFAVEVGPLVTALDPTDLPEGWNVDEITVDPATVATGDDAALLDADRLADAGEEWPCRAEPDSGESEHAQTRLVPYYTWADRGPSTMRTWLPPVHAGSGVPMTEG